MKIEVKSYGHLRNHFIKRFGGDSIILDINDKISLSELIDKLDISRDHYHIILVNGLHVDMKTELKEGDIVAIFPPIAGGLLP